LRKIYGLTYENGHWRIKTNSELESEYKSQDMVSVIKVQRLEWLRHIIRMNKTRAVKKIFEKKLGGRRGRGRPRLWCIDDVEEDLRNMGIKRWRIKALDRVEWTSIIKEQRQTERDIVLQEGVVVLCITVLLEEILSCGLWY
jgi:hypothetical protein